MIKTGAIRAPVFGDGTSIEVKADVDYNPYRDRMSLVHCRLEFVLPYGFNSFFVQTHAYVTDYLDGLWISMYVNDQLYRDDTSILCLTGFIRELRVNGVDDLRSCDPSANAHNSAAITATAAWAYPIATARTDTATRTLTESGTTATSLWLEQSAAIAAGQTFGRLLSGILAACGITTVGSTASFG